MDNVNKSIKEYINSNKYFEDALDWYVNKYVVLPVYNSYLFLIFVIVLISLALSVYSFNGIFPLKQDIPVVLKIEDGINRFSRIYNLKSPNLSSQMSVANYFVTKYVNLRESYNYDNLNLQILQIRNLSNSQVFNEYYRNISLENSDSLLYKIGRRDVLEARNIVIESIDLKEQSQNMLMGDTNVRFTIYLRNSNSIYASERAAIKFLLPKLEKDFEEKRKIFDFKILEYKKIK